jgi:hypothetical protein
MGFKVPFPSGGEVIKQGHTTYMFITEQLIGEMAPDESSAAYDEVTAVSIPIEITCPHPQQSCLPFR